MASDRRKIYVTGSGFDDIGQVLSSMNVAYEPFRGSYDCSLLFVNCGTSIRPDPGKLAEFVNSGGCLYVSDLAGDVLEQAFPTLFASPATVAPPEASMRSWWTASFARSRVGSSRSHSTWAAGRCCGTAMATPSSARRTRVPTPTCRSWFRSVRVAE